MLSTLTVSISAPSIGCYNPAMHTTINGPLYRAAVAHETVCLSSWLLVDASEMPSHAHNRRPSHL